MKFVPVIPVLLLSLPQLVHAAAFSSAGSGNWDAPASWTPAGTPNPFLFDSATINAGHVINYNGVGTSPFPGGNLVVANGNSINVNGGTLTQGWVPGAAPPFGTAIAIGVTGPATGTGTLNINSGGLVDTGTANALAVGITVPAIGASTGNGTVNVNDGQLKIGVGAGAGSPGANGLAVGVDAGATGLVNVGDGTGAAGSAILDLATNNAVGYIGARLSTPAGGTGTVTIQSDGLFSQGAGTVIVGDDASTGTLNISGGSYNSTTGILSVADGGTGTLNLSSGNLSTGGEVRVGIAAGGTGTFNVTGGNATIGGELNIGRNAGGSGAMVQSSGAVGAGFLAVGRDGGTGTLQASGGTLNAVGDINIGRDSTSIGTVTVNGGAVTAQHAELGLGGSSTGTLNISSGSFGSSLFFNVGRDGGVGAINQTGGTVTFGEWMAVGLGAGPTGSRYDISGGSVVSTAGLEVGSDREATMNISGTAVVNTGALHAGLRANSDGKINQSGGTVTTNDIVVGGGQGTGGQKGTYTKTGGDLTSLNLTVGQNGAIGTFTLNGGGNTTVGSPATNEQGLFVGARADHAGGGGATGTVNIQNGTMTVNGWAEVGRGIGSTGTVNITGATSVMNSTGGKDFQVGMDGGVGNLNITAGGVMNHNWWINVARGAGSTGNVLVSGAGSTLNVTAGRIVTGEDGTGSLMVSSGGKVNHNSGDRFMVGKNTGGTGVATVTGAGSSITKTGGEVWIGGDDDGADAGMGTLNVTAGGTFTHTSAGPFLIGINGGTGIVNVSNGGVLTRDMAGANSGDILLGAGAGSNGTMNITNGGKVNNNWWTVISDAPTATGAINIDGPGSQMNIGATDQRFVVGRQGPGTLTLTNGGEVNITNAEMHVGMWAGGLGTVNVDTGGRINALNNPDATDPGARTGSRLIVGTDAGVTGNINLVNGTISVLSGTIGANGMATVNQTGGTMNVGQWTEIGQERDAGTHTPVYNITGGVFNTQSLGIGSRRNGEMNLIGGTVNVGSDGTLTTNYWGGFNIGLYGNEDGGSHGNGTFNMSGGTLNLTEETNVGHQGGTKGVWNLSGGTVNYNVNDRRIHVGRRGDGTMTITGGTINGLQGFNVGAEAAPAGPATKGVLNINMPNATDVIRAGDLYVGYGNRPTSGQTTGTVNVQNGVLRIDGWTEVGRGGAVDGATVGGKGTVNITGPGSTLEHSLGAANDFIIGYEGGVGAVNITGGGKMNHNWWVNLGRGATSSGSVLIDGAGSELNIVGDLVDTNVNIGEDGQGVMNIVNGGRLNVHNNAQLWVGRNAGSSGVLNMATGGTIKAPFIVAGGGTVALNMNNATFIAGVDQGDYFRGFNAGNSEIAAGGLTINTNGFNITANNVMDGAGGLTKTGAGTLVLTANNTYAGTTTVQQGVLQLDGTITGAVVTSTGATLSGIGTVNGPVSLTGATLSPGDGTGIGTLTVGGALSLDSSSLVVISINDEAVGQFDRIVNTGLFSASGASLTGTFADTTFTLGVTEYKFVTGPTDGTIWGNSTPVPAGDIADFGLPANAREVTLSGQRFYLKSGSWALVPIPEPATTALGGAVLLLLGIRRRR